MDVSILGLGKAVPPFVYTQKEVAEKSISILSMKEEKAQLLERLYANSAIKERRSVVDDFHKPRAEWTFWGPNYPETIPGMTTRNAVYKKEAPKLAKEAAMAAIEDWGGDVSAITHIISVSCTGVIAPGIEFYLMNDLGISSSANRLGINFMGCFGAFKGLSVARAFAQENPENRILLVCTELCSLHLQAEHDIETITGNSLFGDGAAAAIIGAVSNDQETPLWNINRIHSLGFKNSMEKMTWEASDNGFLMRLSHTVPVLIGRHIKAFAEELLKQEVEFTACDWAIHPGGKSIIQAVERALELESDQTQSSWETFANYGNMSNGTILFVLDHLRHSPSRPWTACLGFGPGLSAEGILLKAQSI